MIVEVFYDTFAVYVDLHAAQLFCRNCILVSSCALHCNQITSRYGIYRLAKGPDKITLDEFRDEFCIPDVISLRPAQWHNKVLILLTANVSLATCWLILYLLLSPYWSPRNLQMGIKSSTWYAKNVPLSCSFERIQTRTNIVLNNGLLY